MRPYYSFCLAIALLVLSACGDSQQESIQELIESTPAPIVKDKLEVSPNVPDRAKPYVGLITGSNKSWFAGLIDVESRYNPYAESPAGAYGLTQILPSNYEWLESGPCRSLGQAEPSLIEWQIGCGVALYEWGYEWNKNLRMPTKCGNEYIKAALFNGGYYIVWEIEQSGGTWAGGEKICGTRLDNGRKRSYNSCIENYSYPRKISKRQQQFKELGGTECINEF